MFTSNREKHLKIPVGEEKASTGGAGYNQTSLFPCQSDNPVTFNAPQGDLTTFITAETINSPRSRMMSRWSAMH